MGRTKRLKELTIKDNFMFGAVMMDEDNCKGLLERVLEIPIDRVDVSKEKASCIIRSIKVSAWMCMQKMRSRRVITWKCRWRESRHLEREAVIIRVRWTWRCC